ncbi:MAG: type II secretion system major pseudopilin GspG [Gammaproteobacteria bacterium]
MYCRQCGKEVAPGTQFCAGCGAPVGKTKAAPRTALRISPKVWIGLGALAVIALLVAGGRFALDKWQEWRADQLFAEAQQLVQQGQEAEQKKTAGSRPPKESAASVSPLDAEALKYYEAALENVHRLITDYPSTLSGKKTAEPTARLGAHTISELEKIIVPRLRDRALIAAVYIGDTDAIRNLLGKGANPNIKYDSLEIGRNSLYAVGTALHLATSKGHAEIVKLLIKAGADVSSIHEDLTGDSGGQYTALTNAAEGGHAEVIKLLLEAGADANGTANNTYCLTALGHALAGGHADIVDMLLAAEARIDYGVSDYGKPGFVHENCVPSATFVAAAEGGFTSIVKRMLKAGAPPNTGAGYKYATTALIAAAKNGHVDVVRLLLTAGADLDSQDYDGTALGHALVDGHADVVEVLTKAGAKKIRVEYLSDRPPTVITIDDKGAISALRQEKAKSKISLLEASLRSYRQDVGQYPITTEGLEALLQGPPDARNWNGPYLYGDQRIPNDPWGKKYHYESPGKHGEFDLYSLGADNAEGGDGDNKDIVSWKEVDTSLKEGAGPAQSTQESATAAQDLLIGSNTPSPAPTAEAPKVQAGDTYIAESVYPNNPKLNNTTERRVLSVSDKRIDVASRNIKSKTGKERMLQFTPEWNLVGSRNSDGTGVDFSPPLKYFEFPLYPGKTWRQTSIEKNIKTGATREFTLSAIVGDWENISVPAGKFRAIKITTQTALLDGASGQRSTGTDISWYAPDTRRSVKSLVTSRNMEGNAEEQFIQIVRYELK